jgi:uncharacterized protein YjbJ (UPF0337 family)
MRFTSLQTTKVIPRGSEQGTTFALPEAAALPERPRGLLVGLIWVNTTGVIYMDRQRIEGGLKKATGTIKEKAGEALGDRHLENEGRAEKVEGRIRSGVGKAMDAVREVVNSEK